MYHLPLRIPRSGLLVACAISALSAPVGTAFAQSAAADDTDAIVVTAQRRAELLEDVPMSVAAVSGERLEKSNIVGIQDLGQVAAGVQVNYGGVSTQPAIRGISSLTNGLGNENNVAIYIDGFYVTDNQTINQDLANLQSVQVLKGPQGTLYGRNATGGAILINTLDPTAETTARMDLSYARYNEVKASAYASGEVAPGLRAMVAGAYRFTDGWIQFSDRNDNSKNAGPAAKQKRYNFQGKLAFDPSDTLKTTLTLEHAYSSDPTGLLFTPFEHIAPTFIGLPFPGGNARANRFGTASYDAETSTTAQSDSVRLKVEWETPIGTLTSYTGQTWKRVGQKFDFDGSYNPLYVFTVLYGGKTFQQALDYSIDAIDGLDLIVGGVYLYDRSGPIGEGGVTILNGALASRDYRRLETRAYAAYADATFSLTDKLTIGVGGRYSHDDRSVAQQSFGATGQPIKQTPYSFEASFSRFTPRATVRYELAPRSNVYATFSKGFRAGSFNAVSSSTAADNVPVKPEDINSYELGFKTAQSTFRFEIAGYYYDYKNLNVSLTFTCPTGICTRIGNADKAKVYGIDGMLTWTPVDRFNLTIGAAWTHARYGTFINAVGTGLRASTDTNIANQVQNWTGQQLSRAPNYSGNISADYTVDLAGGGLRLAANLAVTDSFVISNPSLFGPEAGALANKQRYRQGGYALLNANVDWTDPSGHLTLGVFGTNLTNKTYRLTYNGAAQGDYSTKARPISIGARIGYKY